MKRGDRGRGDKANLASKIPNIRLYIFIFFTIHFSLFTIRYSLIYFIDDKWLMWWVMDLLLL
jgi:hypothetical protein